MPTKTLKKQPDPIAVRFYMAEDFREEKDGKVSAICLYTDLNVLLQIPPDLPDPTPENPAALRSLCFLFNIIKAPINSSVSIDLQTPGRKQSVVASHALPANDGATNFIIRMDPFIVTELGRQTFTVTINQQKFEFDCYLGRQKTSPTSIKTVPPSTKEIPKSRTKKVQFKSDY